MRDRDIIPSVRSNVIWGKTSRDMYIRIKTNRSPKVDKLIIIQSRLQRRNVSSVCIKISCNDPMT
eukprot:3957001-Karenia_brevis.AAC.1